MFVHMCVGAQHIRKSFFFFLSVETNRFVQFVTQTEVRVYSIMLAPCLMLEICLTDGIMQVYYIVHEPYMTCNAFLSNFRCMTANFSNTNITI